VPCAVGQEREPPEANDYIQKVILTGICRSEAPARFIQRRGFTPNRGLGMIVTIIKLLGGAFVVLLFFAWIEECMRD